ncbi:Cytochrome P450 monooxygenase iccF [Paramyrothecium foliicola]|nr:Cytochrome P450 monooxygenase iccF [Paramyrothecium foliicola]
MLNVLFIYLSCFGIGLVTSQDCPPLPPFEIGPPVPQRPEDVPKGCSPHEVLVARGTSEVNFEPDGKFGVVVGDPVISNLTEVLDGVQGYPVQYPASSDIVNSPLVGAADVVQRLTSQSVKCPRQTFALVGYSQGAHVMRLASERLPQALYHKIKALVVFGDPGLKAGWEFPEALRSKLLQNCADGDPVCMDAPCFYYHFTYIFPEWIDPSVEFIAKALNSTNCASALNVTMVLAAASVSLLVSLLVIIASVAATVVGASILVYWVEELFFQVQVPSEIPLLRESKGARRFSLKTRLAYYTDCKSLFYEAYHKYGKHGKPVVIPGLGFRNEVILPSNSLRWVVHQPPERLDNKTAFLELNQPYQTIGPESVLDPWNIDIIAADMNKKLEHIGTALHEEVIHVFDNAFGTDTENWTEIELQPVLSKAFAQIAGRFTVGVPLCRNAEYNKKVLEMNNRIFMSAGGIGFTPKVLRPIVDRLLNWGTKQCLKDLGTWLAPLWTERVQIHKKALEDPKIVEPEDLFQIMARFAVKNRQEEIDNHELITRRTSGTNFASIHATTTQAVNLFLNIVGSDPEFNTISVLRDEANRIIGSGDAAAWTKTAVSQMINADSVARETMRLFSVVNRTVPRVVMVDDFRLQTGEYLPKGSMVSFLGQPAQTDSETIEEPFKYDPFRFSRERETTEGPRSLITTSADYLVFGHGKHACPGRFVVDFEYKMIMAHVLRHYDLRFPDGYAGKRPENYWLGEAMMPPDVHQHDSATSDLKTTWLPAVTAKSVRADSDISDDENPPASVIHHNATTLALDKDVEANYLRKTTYPGINGTTIFSRRDFSGSLSNRHVSQAVSVVSKRETVHNFSNTHHHNHPLYDTSALWKYDKDHVENSSYTIELDTHMQRALDRYARSVGCSLDFKRSVTPKDFLTMVTNERLRYMPDKGSRLDKILKKAESFGVKFDKIMLALKQIEMPTYESSALVLSSCKTLLGLAGRYSYAVEEFFTVLDEVTAVIVVMSKRLDSEHHHSHHRIYNIFQASLAMVVDVVVDITASFTGQKMGANERSIVTQFESRFEVILSRLTQLRAEFYLQTLAHWCDHGVSSTETLLVLLRGFEDFGIETCPPAYLHILIKVCLSLQSHAESLKWFRFLWVSLEKHRHECDVSYEQWFEVYQEYVVVLGIHEEFSERLLLAEEFQALVLAELGSKHLLYIRARIEFAKILELDEVRYTEAVSLYEELSHYDLHSFGDCREEFLALIEITKYRLSLLFESRPDLSHRAEVLLIDTYTSLKLELRYSDEKVIFALTRIVEYHRKQKRQGSISAAIKVVEQYILGLLVEERKETVLFDVARALAKMYRELASVEIGIKFIQYVKDQVVSGEQTAVEGHCGFGHGEIAQLDRRCFVFIHAFEQLLCGYEREKMLDEIIRDIYTETCLYEAWSVSLRQTSRAIHIRLAAGARLVAFLEKKGRQAEMRQMRTEMWEMFKDFSPDSIGTEHLWQLFELTLVNIHKKAISISFLECLVGVSLDVFTKVRDYAVALQFLRWSQIYFKQFTKTEHSKAVALAFRISECFSRRQHAVTDIIFLELQTISSEILVEVLKVGHLDMDFGTIPFGQLNVIIRLLGERKNFSMLEHILQYLWDTRMSRNWSGAATVATGRRLCEVKFAAGHQTSAVTLLESICYNLRDVYGSLHRLTVECETLLASFHNTCGNHKAAKDIHVHLLEQIGKIDRKNPMHDHSHITQVVLDQTKRLKWACHQKGDSDQEESFYKSLLHKARDYLHGHAGHDQSELSEMLIVGSEKIETEWKLPEDWSLPTEAE